MVRCGPPQPPGCGAGLEVWQFSVACVPRATRHGRAIPEHTAPAESACFHERSAASRPSLATRILPRFYRVLYAFFTPITASAFFDACFTRFLRVFSFLARDFTFELAISLFSANVRPDPTTAAALSHSERLALAAVGRGTSRASNKQPRCGEVSCP